jgi:hypothetical protein
MLRMVVFKMLVVGSLAMILLAAATPARAASKPAPCGYPSSWKLKEIAEAVSPSDPKGRAYVLAWKVVEDDRPLRVESCLVLKELGADAGGGYFLAHLYRHPEDKKPEWNVSMTHVSGKEGTDVYPGMMYTHLDRFATRPTNEEVYTALRFEEVNWTFEIEEGWKVIGSGVCEANWQEALGEKPTRFFEAPKPKPQK